MITSASWYNWATFGYAIALFCYCFNLSLKKESIRKVATITVAISFICQTVGMAFRWVEAGLVEVMAYERGEGTILSGFDWFAVWAQHPPWSNLYEIMVYMSWGLVLVFLVAEVKWRIKFLSIGALLLVLTAIGLASLTDVTIRPLVPALKSWWLMLHVISASIAYAAGTIGAVLSLAYLFKAQKHISMSSIAAGMMVLSAAMGLILGRGFSLLSTGSYKVKLLGQSNDGTKIIDQIVGQKLMPVFVESPFVGPMLLVVIIVSVIAAVLLFRAKNAGDTPNGLSKISYFVASFLMCATILLVIYNDIFVKNIIVSPEVLANLTILGPYTLGFKSNSWDLSLFVIIVVGQLLVGFALLRPRAIRAFLPDEKKIDKSAYANIVVAFALVGVVLVTGALWAHYAWGRYWGWDPKETGALIIWLMYALYLHTRLTKGWSNVRSAVIGILAFFVILAGFLGVNLGFFAGGLHSYGSG